MDKTKRITIDDIAKLAGCSIGTVSRVINNRPDVSESTRRRVLQTMDTVGYRPNAIARGLASSQSHSVALVIPNNTTPFLGAMALSIDRELYKRKYNMILSNTDWDPDIERQKIHFAREHCVDGIIFKPCSDDFGHYKALGVPMILVSQTYRGDMSYIDIENDMVGYLGAEHLLDCGYRRIAFVGGVQGAEHVRLRFEGFLRALRDRGAPFDAGLVRYGDYTIERGRANTMELLDLDDPPDAVFTCSDTVALGAMQAAKERGVGIPDSFGIIGVNNDEVSALPYVSLTTIDQSVSKMGELAAKMMVDMLENPVTWKPQKILLYPELVPRETTRPIRR